MTAGTPTARPGTLPVGRREPAERGSSTVELVLLTPVLMVAVFLIIQTALYLHARQVLLAAAQQGARLARTAPAISSADHERIRQSTLGYIHQLGPRLVSAPTVTIGQDTAAAAPTVTVTVTGRAPSILPGLHLTIREHATGDLEQFHPAP
jgi:Flp pilus assembly protein TadG